MNATAWLKRAKNRIDALDAELILMTALGFGDRAELVAHEGEISPDVLERAEEMLGRRERGEPLAYILGYKEFYGRKFAVDERVLIPRPESEAIIRLALEVVSGAASAGSAPDLVSGPASGRVLSVRRALDVGTGSGCLAVTLAAEMSGEVADDAADSSDSLVEVTACDVSEGALECAACNARGILGEDWARKLTLVKSDLLDNIEEPEKYDLIVANLPYVDRDWDFLSTEALKYEPEMALYAEDGGLALIKKLIGQVREKRLKCRLILEADMLQHDEIIDFVGQKPERVDGYALMFRMGAEE